MTKPAFPKEFLLTDEQSSEFKLNKIKTSMGGNTANHNFGAITEKGEHIFLIGCSCTGSLPVLHRCEQKVDENSSSYLKQVFVSNSNKIFFSKPYKTKTNREYLNTLLSPLTSPYRWWMTPDKYRVVLDDKGDIDLWFCLDNTLSMAEVHGMAILERIFNQHSDNPFWKIWKDSGLPFEAFFYLTHSFYGSFRMGRFGPYSAGTLPYSVFNMFEQRRNFNRYLNDSKSPPAGFSAPRFFQRIPNLDYAKKITGRGSTNYPTVGIPFYGRATANTLWDSCDNTDDRILTIEFEEKLSGILKKYKISFNDSWAKVVNKNSWNFPKETNWNWITDSEKCKEANMIRINEIIELLEEYTPKFLEEKVV